MEETCFPLQVKVLFDVKCSEDFAHYRVVKEWINHSVPNTNVPSEYGAQSACLQFGHITLQRTDLKLFDFPKTLLLM